MDSVRQTRGWLIRDIMVFRSHRSYSAARWDADQAGSLPRTTEKKMSKLANAVLLCALIAFVAGCSGMPPPAEATVCQTHPGTYACQVYRMQNAGS